MAEIFIDGKFYPEEEAKVSVFDHGFLFGDGIFEGISPYDDYVFKLEEHLDLLEESGYEVKEANLGPAEVYTADEIFLSGTAVEIQPVVKIDGRKIGDGKPGELYREMSEKFGKLTGKSKTGTAIYK